jgi:hypothetical protein
MGFYEWTFDNTSSVSPSSSLAHFYPVGGSVPTDDWYISPVFDFFGGGQIDTLWNNYSGFGTPMAGDSIALFLLAGSADPYLATKTILFSFTDSTYNADGIWRKDSNITIPATTGNSYLAFRYYTTNNWLDVKFDNLHVSYTPSGSAINESSNSSALNIYPNPCTDVLNYSLDLVSEQIKSISVIDITGKVVLMNANSKTSLDVSGLERGHYFIKIVTESDILTKSFELK